MKLREKMREELVRELKSLTDDELLSIYDDVNSWDGTFSDMGITRYTLEDLKDFDLLESLVEDLSRQRLDYNPLYNDYFTITASGWDSWEPENLRWYAEDLADYLIENAGYSGFPSWSAEVLQPFGIDGDVIERYCEIARG